MTTDREHGTRIVLSWLREDAHENPERMLLRALDEVETTTQRRPLWAARKDADMRTYLRLGGLAAAVIALAVIGTAVMLGGGLATPSPSPQPQPTTGTLATTPASTPTAGIFVALPEFTLCVPQNGPIKKGTTTVETISGPNGDVQFEQTRGFTWKGNIESTDPRFTGTHYYSWDGNGYLPGSADPLVAESEGQATWAEGHRISTAEGAWNGTQLGAVLPDGTRASGPIVLTGEGGYAGLTAVLFAIDGDCFLDYRGVVMDVPAPPVPFIDG